MNVSIKRKIQVLSNYELQHPLDCNIDVMGKEFKINLGNIEGKIFFPKLSPDFINAQSVGKLEKDQKISGPICPINGITWGNKQDGFGCTEWGQTMSFPKGDTSVKQVMLEFHILENDLEKSSQTIYNYIDSWFERFYDIYEVLSMMPAKRKEIKTPIFIQGYGFRNAGLLLYAADPSTGKFNPIRNHNDNGAHITAEFASGRLKYDELVKIIDLTNVQNDLTFDFRYFLEGLRAFFEEDYKKAITVSAPALEAAILNGIKNFAISKNIYFLDKLLKKYRMLGGYFALANDINMELPTQDYKSALLDLRNNVVHNGYEPTKEEADKYLKDVRLYLDTF